jgi:hypothetical protein
MRKAKHRYSFTGRLFLYKRLRYQPVGEIIEELTAPEGLKAVTTWGTAFWDVTPYSPTEVHWRFVLFLSSEPKICRKQAANYYLPWRWKQYVPPKHRWTRGLQGVISHQIILFELNNISRPNIWNGYTHQRYRLNATFILHLFVNVHIMFRL